jgi:hypothetical protein
MIYPELMLFIYLCLSILSLVVLVLLIHKYLVDDNKKSAVHTITRMLSIMTFFLLFDSIINLILYASQLRLLPVYMFIIFSSYKIELITKLGIFFSTIVIVHFLMEKRIEQFKDHETSLMKLQTLNHELEKKTKELEYSHETLQKKLHQLESFNEIAKHREVKMLSLIKKIEDLEKQLKKGKN